MDDMIIPGFATQAESLAALGRTGPELALMSLMMRSSAGEFLCIGRDEHGEPTVVVISAAEFLGWLRRRPGNKAAAASPGLPATPAGLT